MKHVIQNGILPLFVLPKHSARKYSQKGCWFACIEISAHTVTCKLGILMLFWPFTNKNDQNDHLAAVIADPKPMARVAFASTFIL
jgi:hypothetical protein